MPAKRRKRSPLPRIGARTVIVSRRGVGSATSQGGGDFVFFAAAVAGGQALLEIAVVKGAVQPALIPAPYSFEAFDYALGVASGLAGGFGWDGAAALPAPFIRLAGEEGFESYAEGAIAESALTAGTGWDGGAALPQPDAHLESVEDFESYGLGAANGSAMTGGSGWNGDTAIYGY
ncbi:MAG TPA: hypothetical protein VLD18_15345 [Verrucomicrobiae bacterium]|nr:hypothetical protein [Verrucomicrobiae bacterium]